MRPILLFLAFMTLLQASDSFFLSQNFRFDDKGNGWTVLHFELLYPSLEDLSGTFTPLRKTSSDETEGFVPFDFNITVRDENAQVINTKRFGGKILAHKPWGVRGQLALPGAHTEENTAINLTICQHAQPKPPPPPAPKPPKKKPVRQVKTAPPQRSHPAPSEVRMEKGLEFNRTAHDEMTFEKFQVYKQTEAYQQEIREMDAQRKQFLRADEDNETQKNHE